MIKLTKIVTILFVVGLIAYDFYAIIEGGEEATISYIVMELSYKMPLVPFLVGVLCGHFFWRIGGKPKK